MNRLGPTAEDSAVFFSRIETTSDWYATYNFFQLKADLAIADESVMDQLTALRGIPPAVKLTLAALADLTDR